VVLLNSCNVSKNFIIIPIVCFFIGVFTVSSPAKTISARSCTLADVQAAVSEAVSGDIVALPKGKASWSSSLKIATKNLTLQGNGIGSTIISGGSKSISLTGESANGLRITGIEFQAGSQLIFASGTGTPRQAIKNFRVDNCKFTGTYIAIETNGGATGVFDHCVFENTYGARLYGSNDAVARPPYKLGTDDAVFFEDNNIKVTPDGNPPHFIASNSHSKYVIRHNTFDYQKSLWNIVDAHGACEVKGRGSATWEIYDNTFKLIPTLDQVINLRGGQGVVFNNTFTGDYIPRHPIAVTDYAVCVGNCTQSCTVYPCVDMINHAYFWNNNIKTTPVNPINNCSVYIKLDRDYRIIPMPGYTPFTYPHPLTKSNPGTVATSKNSNKTAFVSEKITVKPGAHRASTLITYNLEQNSPVKIAVFSINGTMIKSLVDDVETIGNHQVTWDASGVPNGLYLIKSSIDNVQSNFKVFR
jgi:hypothetical protein